MRNDYVRSGNDSKVNSQISIIYIEQSRMRLKIN